MKIKQIFEAQSAYPQAIWKPLVLQGALIDDEWIRRCPTCNHPGYQEQRKGKFPVLRCFRLYHYDDSEGVALVETKYGMLLDPKPIIVEITGDLSQPGKRLTAINIVSGGDQLITRWTKAPSVGQSDTKGANASTKYSQSLDAWNDPMYGNTRLAVMTKDLKRR